VRSAARFAPPPLLGPNGGPLPTAPPLPPRPAPSAPPLRTTLPPTAEALDAQRGAAAAAAAAAAARWEREARFRFRNPRPPTDGRPPPVANAVPWRDGLEKEDALAAASGHLTDKAAAAKAEKMAKKAFQAERASRKRGTLLGGGGRAVRRAAGPLFALRFSCGLVAGQSPVS